MPVQREQGGRQLGDRIIVSRQATGSGGGGAEEINTGWVLRGIAIEQLKAAQNCSELLKATQICKAYVQMYPDIPVIDLTLLEMYVIEFEFTPYL